MRVMRAKMQVQSVQSNLHNQVVTMAAVCGKAPYGAEGESEDNTFARYTPSGSIMLTITNPDLYSKLSPGQKFYVDLTEAAE